MAALLDGAMAGFYNLAPKCSRRRWPDAYIARGRAAASASPVVRTLAGRDEEAWKLPPLLDYFRGTRFFKALRVWQRFTLFA
jgi:hypothetical protein